MEKIRAESLIIKLFSLVPYRVRLVLQKSKIMPLLRNSLNFFLGLNNILAVVTVDAGQLKGYRLALYRKVEKAYWFGVWEAPLQDFFASMVCEGMVVYDVGAHIGFFSLLFSKYCDATGKVFSFEPHPTVFGRLQKNITLNNISNTQLVKLAISDEKGTASFIETEIDSMGHLQYGQTSSKTQKVATDTMDNFVYGEKNPAPDLVKIDVEGAEGQVLKGMEQILQKARPIIVCEVHNYEAAQEFSGILASHNYQLFNMGKNLLYLTDLKEYSGICHILAKPK